MRSIPRTLPVSCLSLALACSVVAQTAPVARNLADPGSSAWRLGAFNSASGRFAYTNAVPESTTSPAGSLQVAADYSGKGFEFFAIAPVSGTIPGTCKRVSVQAYAASSSYAWALKFKDAKGREEVNGKKLEVSIKLKPGVWTRTEFVIPSDWEQPLALSALQGHNWNAKTTAAHTEVLLNDLKVETDILGVGDPRSLVHVSMEGPAANQVVVTGESAAWKVVADSWLGIPLSGSLTWSCRDEQGATVTGGVGQIAFTSTSTERLDLKLSRYGVYRIAAEVALSNGMTFASSGKMAYIPKAPVLSEEQKDLSPYGINVHGGMVNVPYGTVSRVGFSWIRDYAYSWSWMLRAKGADGQYAGWPWYPKMDKKAHDAGLRVLPILMGAMGTEVAAGKLVPDQAWKRSLLHILISFPQYTHWELDNEYDLRNRRDEESREWSSYRAYHKLFSEAVQFVDSRVTAVENGSAGVYPDRVRASIKSGAFAQIGVVNAHFYCGTRPPELSRANANTGQGDAAPVMVSDSLKDLVSAAGSDGRARKTWITEFGWDTLAVHIVSEKEQAAYLQRCYMLGFQAGIDRMFWYWDRDTKDKPSVFFDGCGILDPREEPKPALAAMAGLVQRLTLPKPVGSCDFGPNTMGYVFKDRGHLVGCAFKVEPDGPEATVQLPKGRLFDLYGNPLSERRVKLDVGPVWVEELPETDPMYLQTAYDLMSRRYIRATAGDPFTVELRVRNNRTTPLKGEIAVSAPKGWNLEGSVPPVSLAPGEEKRVPVRVTIDPQAAQGLQAMSLVAKDSGTEKTMRVEVEVLPFATARAEPLAGAPGTATLKIALKNNSLQARGFTLTPTVPRGWRVEPASIKEDAVPAEGTRQATFSVTWNTAWKPGELAELSVSSAAGERITGAPVIPGAIPVPSVSGITFDGDVKEWPAAARLPAWALGCTSGEAAADYYVGWSTEGLCLAAVVKDSKAEVMDTKAFWGGDCLELFVDTQNDKTPRKAYQPTDHQFWLCPLVKEGRVYVGRWKRSAEIAAHQFDLPGIRSGCRKTADGYVMEVMLPASCLKGYAPVAGGRLALNLNLSVHGVNSEIREVYWPSSKGDTVQDKPATWGIGELR